MTLIEEVFPLEKSRIQAATRGFMAGGVMGLVMGRNPLISGPAVAVASATATRLSEKRDFAGKIEERIREFRARRPRLMSR